MVNHHPLDQGPLLPPCPFASWLALAAAPGHGPRFCLSTLQWILHSMASRGPFTAISPTASSSPRLAHIASARDARPQRPPVKDDPPLAAVTQPARWRGLSPCPGEDGYHRALPGRVARDTGKSERNGIKTHNIVR